MTCDVDDPNVQAFLRLIRFAEHYPDDTDNWFDSLYGGGKFTGYQSHPNQNVHKWNKTSTAAGAYQILYGTWKEAKDKDIVADFTPASQNKLAFTKLKSRGALTAVCAGDVRGACGKLASEWTALPGAKQMRMTMKIAEDAFVRYGGKLKR